MNTIKNIFPVSQKLSLCYNKIPCVFLSGKSKTQIPCFPCAVAPLSLSGKGTLKFPVFPVPWPLQIIFHSLDPTTHSPSVCVVFVTTVGRSRLDQDQNRQNIR